MTSSPVVMPFAKIVNSLSFVGGVILSMSCTVCRRSAAAARIASALMVTAANMNTKTASPAAGHIHLGMRAGRGSAPADVEGSTGG